MTTRGEAGSAAGATAGLRPPVARKIPTTTSHHGIARTDDYAWLRDDNWQEVMRAPEVLAPDIRAYLEAENAYAKAAMADTDDLQKILFEEMRGRIKEDDSSVPLPDGAYAYATRYQEGAEHPLITRSPRDGGDEQILLDVDAMAKGSKFFRLGGFGHSPDHRLMAYSTDTKGSEYFTLRIRNLTTGSDLDDTIEDTTGGVVWSPSGEAVYYVHVDQNHRPCRVLRHDLGTDSASDHLIYDGADPRYFVGAGETLSRRFVLIDSHDHETSEIRVVDQQSPGAGAIVIAARREREEYQIEHRGESFYILTNSGGAEDFKIASAPVDAPGRENWTTLIPHQPGRLILAMTVFADFLVRLEREDGLPRIVVRDLESGHEHTISFDEEAYSLGLQGGFEFDTANLRFSYSSMTTPTHVYDYDMASRTRVLRKVDEIPSGHERSDYVTERIQAPTADGETVPVSLLYRKGTRLDGSAPCLLYGYGAYGISIPSSFSTTRLSLVDRGFVYAIAHIRGGKDKGYRWYADGRREKKPNTFSDFAAAAEHLIHAGYTSTGGIVGWGGSAGGLLIGAVANLAPEHFAGLIAEVPFVDTLATMLDDTLPLTPPEWPEWGNPIVSEKDYRTIGAYSPYDNVSARDYPAILALGGLADPRVTYWEPAKWIARLRATKTNDRLTVLRTNMDAGHGGASGRFARLHETALATAFALKVTGSGSAPA
jgi:oligopeptidase B